MSVEYLAEAGPGISGIVDWKELSMIGWILYSGRASYVSLKASS